MNLVDIAPTHQTTLRRAATVEPVERIACGCYINISGRTSCGNCWGNYRDDEPENCYHPGTCHHSTRRR